MNVDFIKKHPEWPLVKEISRVLTANGFQAVLAGGCVRDALLGKVPHDLDVATDATPDEVEKLFPHVVPVGKSFGVCRVVSEGQQVEVATFREESDYQDGRRPEVVVYANMQKDALRRDFTINAMFFDLQKNQLVDLVEGAKDLSQRLIRTVGNPHVRFSEDYLRIMRAVRFTAQLGFRIEAQTAAAMAELVSGMAKISQERIQEECHKAFKSPQPLLFFQEAKKCGLLPYLFLKDMATEPEDHLKKFFSLPVEEPAIAWAELGLYYLRNTGNTRERQNALRQFFKDKKLSNEIQQQIQNILDAESFFIFGRLKDFVALVKTGNLSLIESFWLREELSTSGTREYADKLLAAKNKYFVNGALPEPQVRGEDLKALGVNEGPGFKDKLDAAYLFQLENPGKSKSEILEPLKK